jgi:Flp pilus assembly protein TadG
MRRLRSPARALKPRVVRPRRRGATLVLVALSLTVIMGIAGFAVDFSRMYAFSTQLKVLTDAASLSGITDLKSKIATEAEADERALALRAVNRVEGQVLSDADMSAADIQPGVWDFTARTFTPGAWATANAVQATARYTAGWTLARIFGVNTRVLTRSSVAALGSPQRSTCFKPWAVPYTRLLERLGQNPSDTAYRLTAEDVAALRDNQVPISFKIASVSKGETVISGSFYAVRYPPIQYVDGTAGEPSKGANDYRDAIADVGCTSTGSAGVGDWLDIEQGNMQGPTDQGVSTFCGASNKETVFACPKDVIVPIWNGRTTSSGNTWVQILYVGAFRMTTYDTKEGLVTGHLTALAAPVSGNGGGSFTPFPGPVMSAALVQ